MINVISGAAAQEVSQDATQKFCYIGPNYSWDVPPAHFVMGNEQRSANRRHIKRKPRVAFRWTRIPLIGGARRNPAPFNLKIYADILYVINSDIWSNRGRTIRLFAGCTRLTHFYALFDYILQPIGQQVTSYPPRLRAMLYPIRCKISLSELGPEIFALSERHFLRFSAITSDRK